MKKKIAVLYLAHNSESVQHFENFAKSYCTYEAGQEHDLIVIYKGKFRQSKKARVERIFREISHTSFTMPDEGFDIHAYLYIAEKINHEYVCLFNTYSELLSHNWLRKLYSHLQKPSVGLVGTTASYESRLSSSKLLEHIRWLNLKKIKSGKEALLYFGWMLEKPSLSSKIKTFLRYNSFKKMVLVGFRRLWKLVNPLSPLERHESNFEKYFETIWVKIMGPEKDAFPSFPNPHIRSNGLMVRRKFLLEFQDLEKTREACYRFESGKDGLTNRLLKKGLSVLLVGGNGQAYSVKDWPKSKTFRLEKQQNLIMRDNQVAQYAAMTESEQIVNAYMTWGHNVDVPLSLRSFMEELGYINPVPSADSSDYK